MPHLIHFINRCEYSQRTLRFHFIFVRKQSLRSSQFPGCSIFFQFLPLFQFSLRRITNAAICMFQCLWDQRSRHRQQNRAGHGNYLFLRAQLYKFFALYFGKRSTYSCVPDIDLFVETNFVLGGTHVQINLLCPRTAALRAFVQLCYYCALELGQNHSTL
jgi:hypothetical protein